VIGAILLLGVTSGIGLQLHRRRDDDRPAATPAGKETGPTTGRASTSDPPGREGRTVREEKNRSEDRGLSGGDNQPADRAGDGVPDGIPTLEVSPPPFVEPTGDRIVPDSDGGAAPDGPRLEDLAAGGFDERGERLLRLCQHYVDVWKATSEDMPPARRKHLLKKIPTLIFQAVLEWLYGRDVWRWLREERNS
jgi:hypothetical protein